MYEINISKKLKCFCLIHVNKPGNCSLGHGRSGLKKKNMSRAEYVAGMGRPSSKHFGLCHHWFEAPKSLSDRAEK